MQRTFKNHANLLTYLVKLTAITLENGFQGGIKCQGGPLLGFAQVYSAIVQEKKNCQNGLLLKHGYVTVDYHSICSYMCGHIDNLPMLN